jgi:hypothetical protein
MADDQNKTTGRRVVLHKEDGMAFDALAELRAAGNPVDQLNEAQREVMQSLSPAEVAVLNSIKTRVEAVSDEVQGHFVGGIGIF